MCKETLTIYKRCEMDYKKKSKIIIIKLIQGNHLRCSIPDFNNILPGCIELFKIENTKFFGFKFNNYRFS